MSGAHPALVRCCRMRPVVGFAATVTEPFRSGKRVRARVTARQAPFRQSAERLAAALRSGALTGRAHARKGPPAMFGMPLSAPAGQTSQGAMRVPRRTNWHPSGLTKVCLAGEREQVIVCAKLSCMTGRSGTRKPEEFPVICVPIPVLIHRRMNHVSVWLSSPFEAVDCSHFAALFSPSSNRCCDLV